MSNNIYYIRILASLGICVLFDIAAIIMSVRLVQQAISLERLRVERLGGLYIGIAGSVSVAIFMSFAALMFLSKLHKLHKLSGKWKVGKSDI